MPEPSVFLSPEERDCTIQWLQRFHLSSRIKKLNRDLSDGVLIAEILHQLFPRLVELHNYTKGFAITRKLDNWDTLNRKVFKKLELCLTPQMMHDVANGKEGAVDVVLFEIMMKTENLEGNQQT